MTGTHDIFGLIAGGGSLPRLLIDAIQARGATVHVVALKSMCEAQTVVGVSHRWMRLGAGGHALKWLASQGAWNVAMAGKVYRPALHQLWPDWTTIKFMVRHGYQGPGDNRLLESFEKTIDRWGFSIVGALDLAPGLAAPAGTIAGPTLPDALWPAVSTGIAGAIAHGAADLGQAVVARDGEVVAKEERAGTDALLAGLADGRGRGGVLVKLPKPQQDLRLDPPVVGQSTLQHARAAGLAGVVMASGRTLLLDRERVSQIADAAGISVYGADRDLLDRSMSPADRPGPARPES